MKLETKKVLAREFMILIAVMVIGLSSFLGTYLYNFYQHKKSKNISKEIYSAKLFADSLSKPFNSKIKQHIWFYNQNNEKVNLSKAIYNNPRLLWQRLDEIALKDSIIIRYHQNWTPELKAIFTKIGFKTPEKLLDFINKNRITNTDSLMNVKANDIRKKITILKTEKHIQNSKILSFTSQVEFGWFTFCISLLVFFALRYIYYAIRWSIKILKQSNTDISD